MTSMIGSGRRGLLCLLWPSERLAALMLLSGLALAVVVVVRDGPAAAAVLMATAAAIAAARAGYRADDGAASALPAPDA